MEKLESLPSITRLSERVLRILGQNPSKFTLQGTNTYLLGRGNPYILVDTGEGQHSYISQLDEALRETTDAFSPLISDIILTHRHEDHTHGLPSVLALLRQLWGDRLGFRPPRIHKFPLSPNSSDQDLQAVMNQLPSYLFVPEPTSGGPIHQLQALQTLRGNDTTLQILHTPGHTTDSICLYLAEERSLFTADTVLGQGTAVFEDLAAYIASLRFLLKFDSQPSGKFIKVYPGHGPVVNDGPKIIEDYIKHRMERENQIVQVMSSSPGEPWTVGALVANIYAGYPQSLWAAAAGSVQLHLTKLEKEGKVTNLGSNMEDSRWRVTAML